jgi:chromosome segregation ATPase
MARLVFRDSQGREGTVELTPNDTVYVGRGLECAIRTDDGMVSRRHSQIRMQNGRYTVEDLGSSNGTHLNNVRVQSQALGHGDVVQCGSLVIRFFDEGAVGVVPQQNFQGMGGAPPPKKGGTMVLERNEIPPLPPTGQGGPPPGFPPGPQSQPYGYAQPPPTGPGFGQPPQGMAPPQQQNPYGYGQPQNPPTGPGYPPPPQQGAFGGRPIAGGGPPFSPPAMAGGAPGGAPLPYGGPPAMPGQGQAPQGSPPHVSGTAATAYGGPPANNPQSNPAYGSVPSGPSGLISKGPPSVPPGSMFGSRGGFGGAAGGAAPSGGGLPYGGPPAMPGAGGSGGTQPGGGAGLPYGGPPAMPGGGQPIAGGGPPFSPPASMFQPGGPGNPQVAGRPRSADEKVMVDLGLQFDPQKADGEIRGLRGELEKVNTAYEREVADGKRVRAEAATLRERVDELRAQIKDREEQVTAHDRVAEELRDELQQTRNELTRARGEIGEMAENMTARERQAARAVEDTAKIREDMEDLNRQLMELARTKDEGWKKLNEQLTEIEHLREVINEQERMLEERRVGLISQEEVIKELRGDKEKNLKSLAQLKAERDEHAQTASRTSAQIVALEEENRRLGRMLVEAQTDSSRGGGGSPDQIMRLTTEAKDLRVELKKLEADRDRLAEQHELADRDRTRLEGKLAQTQVELQEVSHAKLAAESARNVAQDALAKSEIARAKAAEEALAAAKARDAASTGGDDARRELDRLRKRVAELEAAGSAAGAAPAVDPKELQREREASDRKLKDAQDSAAAAERSLKALQAEVDAAKTDAQKARAEVARARAAADSKAEAVVEAAPAPVIDGEMAKVAREVYEAINDILSEMRNNMVLVQGELPNLQASPQTMQAVHEAVEGLVAGAETAKGSLRMLRDLANGKLS